MRVQDGVNQAAGEGSEGPYNAVVPGGYDGLAVVREDDRGAAEVRDLDAQELLVGGRVPDAHVVLARRGEHFREVAGNKIYFF